MNKGFYIILIITIVAFSSCKKDKNLNDEKVDVGYNYFPDKVGHYVIYDVDSVVYDDFINDTLYSHHEVKEVIESTFIDNLGKPALRIERYVRDNDTSVWILSDVWSANRLAATAERVEENIRFVVLSFPVKVGKIWKGNVYNTIEDWDYEYNDMDVPRTVGTLSFDSTLSVTQFDDEGYNLLNRQYYYEVYARNVGLVYREVIDVSDNSVVFGVPVEDRIESGFKTKITIKQYGN